ncbi:MAG: 3-deoxy-manno-octulosonate cytidylyltransferase [bacterium]
MKTIGIIPARYQSSRFEGKAIVILAGKPLIQHVCERAARASTLDEVIVATDDERIFNAVHSFGGTAVMTSPDHRTGTDRLAEVAAARADVNLIVNIQGDEPLMDPALIDNAVRRFSQIPDFKFGSAMTPIKNDDDLNNPNVVKVVVDRQNRALYFSRHSIPFKRRESDLPTYQHIGFYIYTRDFLLEFSKMPTTPLERTEALEQLRALENGIEIHLLETDYIGIGVDTPDDIPRVEAMLIQEST